MARKAEDLTRVGWRTDQVESFMNWCRHTQEVITLSGPDGSLPLVPVLGEPP